MTLNIQESGILNAIKSIFSSISNVPTSESESLTSLLSIFFNPSVDIDVRAIMRSLSDPIVEYMIKNRAQFPDHPMMKMIFQLFFIEWCHRNGYLLDDWIWRWDGSGKNGSLDLNPRMPLNSIPLPVG